MGGSLRSILVRISVATMLVVAQACGDAGGVPRRRSMSRTKRWTRARRRAGTPAAATRELTRAPCSDP